MKLLLIKSIFIPTDQMVDINIQTLELFIKYLQGKSHLFTEISIKLIGWIGNIDKNNREKYMNHIENQQTHNQQISIHSEIWGENKGKAYLFQNIRTIYPSYRKYNFIIYADHDISPIDDIISQRTILDNYLGGKQVVMVSFKQQPDDRHNQTVFINSIKINGSRYYHTNDNRRIATGCFITTPQTFNILSEVVSTNIYGDEDIQIGNILNNRGVCNIVSELKVNHPYDNDMRYAEWKKEQILRISGLSL